MKRTIRLNESELVRIVEGTARRMLTELDWKTYANAARKAKKRADMGEDEYMNTARDAYRRYTGNRPDTFPEEDEKGNYRRMKDRNYHRYHGFDKAAADAFNRDHFHGEENDWREDEGQYLKHMDKKIKGSTDPYPWNTRCNTVFTNIRPSSREYGTTVYGPYGYFRWNPIEGIRGWDEKGFDMAEHIPFVDKYMRERYAETDPDVYNEFTKASDEMYGYNVGDYRYRKGRGWKRD